LQTRLYYDVSSDAESDYGKAFHPRRRFLQLFTSRKKDFQIRNMDESIIQTVKFDERGLVPAIVQDAASGDVLMMAFMNAESLAKTLETLETWFWSRSRSELWHKGATSGNTQRVLSVAVDCDGDTLLIKVEPQGPACHTGERTCFFRQLVGDSE
jgi:phosphoribosyl-ATP pyrophosphohydrolase/phosphoribosyl-AMP cyclohydrolase